MAKLQSVLRTLGFTGIVVLVDRVDEPYLINGSAELMKALVWPMLDNKLLKHPGMGFKLLLPAELIHFVDREDRDFHQRARLDKQNLIRSLEWTGQSLYDLAGVAAEGLGRSVAARRPWPSFSIRISSSAGWSTSWVAADAAAPVQVPLPAFRLPHQRPYR